MKAITSDLIFVYCILPCTVIITIACAVATIAFNRLKNRIDFESQNYFYSD